MMDKARSIERFVEEHRTSLKTPYYLIDEQRMVVNLEKIASLRKRSGAKVVLALKCFSTWAAFDLIREYLDGTTSSSLFEARLGYEKFGKEVHAYSVAFSEEELAAVRPYATKIIFNSVSQLKRFYPQTSGVPIGLRVNPGVSNSDYDLADPARQHSRLGATNRAEINEVAELISGLMFHCNCENEHFEKFGAIVDRIARDFGGLLEKMQWISLGGGISFTRQHYAFDDFCRKLEDFSHRFGVQVYLEPGEAVITRSGFLVTSVLDIVHNGKDIAIVDAGVETHMLDLLIYKMEAKIDLPVGNGYDYLIAGRTCLAGDVFGAYTFPERLEVGSLIPLADAAGYSLVKKNWFNGIAMPSIVMWRLNGQVDVVRQFGYEDYVGQL